MILERTGDLFRYSHQAYAHGVSNAGRMGRGIATRFKKEYNDMFRCYQAMCRNGKLNPGEVFFWEDHSGRPHVFNLVIQDNLSQASPGFLEDSISRMYAMAREKGITDIGMPKIGCGLGNLDEKMLYDSLTPFKEDSRCHVTIYSLH